MGYRIDGVVYGERRTSALRKREKRAKERLAAMELSLQISSGPEKIDNFEVSDYGGYQIFDEIRNEIAAGRGYRLTIYDVEQFISEEETRNPSTPRGNVSDDVGTNYYSVRHKLR